MLGRYSLLADLIPQVSDRRRQGWWNVRCAAEFSLGNERKSGAAVRLHRIVRRFIHVTLPLNCNSTTRCE